MKRIAAILASFLVVACASTPKPVVEITPNATSTTASTVTVTPAPSPVPTAKITTSPISEAEAQLAAAVQKVLPNNDAATNAKLAAELIKLHEESVYFDYDQYSIKQEFKSILEKQTLQIKNNGIKTVILEGHADERGSAAYNLALAARRSTSVKKGLVQLGIPASKIKVVSYGNTKPKLNCHEELCWHENRRVDFIFKKN